MTGTILADFDIGKNIREAAKHRYDPIWFGLMVKTGSPWDYKQGDKHPELRDLGNFNYGATGGANGIPAEILLRAAGA